MHKTSDMDSRFLNILPTRIFSSGMTDFSGNNLYVMPFDDLRHIFQILPGAIKSVSC